MRSSFKTAKGTELPIIDLKGKEYLQVAHRVVWFREDFPLGRIETERISESDKQITYRATVYVPVSDQYIKLANADKTIAIKSTLDYEKAETGAIGRALALCGYGTQFADDDLDEGDDLADAPIGSKKNPETPPQEKITEENAAQAYDAAQVSPKLPKGTPGVLPNCSTCGALMKVSKAKTSYYCPNFKDEAKGKHHPIKIQGAQS